MNHETTDNLAPNDLPSESSDQFGKPDSGKHITGIMLLLGAALLWSLNGALIKLLTLNGDGPNGVTIAFYRSLIAGLFLIPFAKGKFHTLRSKPHIPARMTGEPDANGAPPSPTRGWIIRPAGISCVVFFTAMTLCFVVANIHTQAANAIILQYTSTFWIFGLSPLILKEKPRLKDLWILAIAMMGIIIIFQGNAANDFFGLMIALGAGLFFALLTLMIRQMRDSNSAAVMVLNNLGSALLLLPFALWAGDLMLNQREWILITIMGVVQFGLPYYLYTLGLVKVRAYEAALITLAEPILVPVWTYLAVKEIPNTATFFGGGTILLALLLFVWTATRKRKRFNL